MKAIVKGIFSIRDSRTAVVTALYLTVPAAASAKFSLLGRLVPSELALAD